MKKKPLRTSLRSETHATDSTLRGCQAKTAATNALRKIEPVIALNNKNSKTLFMPWIKRLVRWWPPGDKPNNWQSIICETQVRGCQLLECASTKAQAKPQAVSPAETVLFS